MQTARLTSDGDPRKMSTEGNREAIAINIPSTNRDRFSPNKGKNWTRAISRRAV